MKINDDIHNDRYCNAYYMVLLIGFGHDFAIYSDSNTNENIVLLNFFLARSYQFATSEIEAYGVI
jgi:hypothetical protein